MPHKIIEKEKIKHKDKGSGIVKEKDIFADYKHKCKKCGYEKAEVIDLGAQYSDENELIMLKCGKCGYTERIEKKTS
jgi:DNA-directed RNA polymerase subunit M/transcription elongation factor TFIIS